jgi:hypothetical protein
VLSGVLAGLSVQHCGFTTTLLLCGGVALAGVVTFQVGARRGVDVTASRSGL